MNEFKTIDFLYTLINNMVWRKDFEVSKQECLDWLSKKLVVPQGLNKDAEEYEKLHEVKAYWLDGEFIEEHTPLSEAYKAGWMARDRQGLSVDGKLLDGFLYTHFGPNFFDMGYKTPIEGAPKEGDAIDVTVNIIEK